MKRTLTCLTICGALTLLSSPGQAQQQFSGRWSVQAITEEGACSRAYRYPILIQDGAVRHGGSAGPAVSGRVQANGEIQGSIQRDTTRADVIGRLSERSGSGTWRTSGAVSCSGRWNAEKRS
jgi:hypothetical protein